MLRQSREFSIWRYKALLPVDAEAGLPPLSVGWTPMYHISGLASNLGLSNVWVKDDGRQPTASFKDRASAVAVVKAAEKGAKIITTASTGNAAAAFICTGPGKTMKTFSPNRRFTRKRWPTASAPGCPGTESRLWPL